jgi:hypothetical protein
MLSKIATWSQYGVTGSLILLTGYYLTFMGARGGDILAGVHLPSPLLFPFSTTGVLLLHELTPFLLWCALIAGKSQKQIDRKAQQEAGILPTKAPKPGQQLPGQ